MSSKYAPRLFIIFAFLAITLLTFIIYSNTFTVPFQFDDVKHIAGIKELQTLDVHRIFRYSKSRFLACLTFAVNFYFGGYNVFGYHLLNLIIHIVTAIFVFLLCLSIFSSHRFENSVFRKNCRVLSFFSALLFAGHPIQTESVTYIYQRAESMAGMFYLLSLLSYARFRLSQIYRASAEKCIFFYSLCMLSAVLCFLTKPTSISLPAGIMLYEMCFVSRDRKEFKRSFLFIFPILLCTALPILLAKYDTEETRGVGIRFAAYYMPYYYTKLRVLVDAFRLMFFPVNQRIAYDFALSQSLGEPIMTFYSLIFHLFLIGFAVFSFKRYAFISFAIGWFYLMLFGTTVLFLDDLFFEHYLYLPLFGYAFLLPVLILMLLSKMHMSNKWAMVFLIILVLVYSAGTYNRNKVWRTEISLWEDAVKKSPHDARANYTLGVYYFRVKRFDDALRSYRLALRYRPYYPEAYYRLGEYWFSAGDTARSIANYKKAIGLKADFFEAYFNLGSVYLNTKSYRDAKFYFNKALAFTKDADYIGKINYILTEIGRYD